MYCIDSVHSLISKQNKGEYGLKFILGILNSTLGAYIYELLICETGKVFAQVKLTFLRRFPIKVVPAADQLQVVHLVDQILKVRKLDPRADITVLEREIDRLVYGLYGLTKAEIAIVEKAVA